MNNQLLRFAGHRVRESFVHASRWSQNKSLPRAVFLVDGPRNGLASGLRGWAVARELRNHGWRTSVIPSQCELTQRSRIVRAEQPDCVVIQKARHPLNRPRYFQEIKCVFDLDDADFLDDQLEGAIVECATEADLCIAGSTFVADWLRQYNSNVQVIWSAYPFSTGQLSPAPANEPPIVVWAVSDPLGYLPEAEFVACAVARAQQLCNFRFRVIGGPREKASEVVDFFAKRKVAADSIPFQPYRKLLRELKQCDVGLAPLNPSANPYSAGKSFGKVLAYLATGVPVIAANEVDHPLFFDHGNNGWLANDVDEFVDHIELVVKSPELRKQVRAEGHASLIRRLSVEAAATRLDRILRENLIDEHAENSVKDRVFDESVG